MAQFISWEDMRNGVVEEPCADFDVDEIVGRKMLQEQVRKEVAKLPENKRQEVRVFINCIGEFVPK